MDYYDREMVDKGYRKLAEVDESESYEVDTNQIWHNAETSKYVLRSASGCSCWDGTWDETEYDSLDAIEDVLTSSNGSGCYSPTLKGAEKLLREARASA